MMMIQHHAAAEFVQRCMDHFERAVRRRSAKRPKVMAIAVHPYISGVPHRIKYFERVFQALKKQPRASCSGRASRSWSGTGAEGLSG